MKKYLFAALVIFASCKKDKAVIDMSPIDAKGDIFFISRRISNSPDWQMYVMHADGTNQRLISNSIVPCSPPVVSNSGRQVAFLTCDSSYIYSLNVINIDGTGQKILSAGKPLCYQPAWSPDDSHIVFVKNDNAAGGRSDIYTINTDGSNETKLTTQGDNFTPQYLGNNSILYASSNSTPTGIYKMNTDGSSKQLLSPAGKSFSNPLPSPDEKLITFVSNDWNGGQVFVMNANGSNVKQLTFTVNTKYFDTGFPREGNGNPVWSPNSARIAYVSYESGNPDIFVINADGTGNQRLTDNTLRDEYPSFTKDGNYIIFTSNRDVTLSSEIYIMRTEGQLQTPLTHYIADDIYPSFISK